MRQIFRMNVHNTPNPISKELLRHAPFTAFGAITGIIIMFLTISLSPNTSERIFYTLHPIHVLLSALVTAGMYRLYRGKGISVFLIGYIGSVGIATISDILFPYLGGILLGAEMEFHLGFIEKWWLVNPLAVLGIAIAYWKPTTKFPHAGHVLLSTWASLFYLTAFGCATEWILVLPFVFLILFFSVWFPCCLSDIIFPLLFVRESNNNL
ncbi:MAG: hypothetical protein QMD22_06520 [archaeon]|nr:hypothetical protein [archaeon]